MSSFGGEGRGGKSGEEEVATSSSPSSPGRPSSPGHSYSPYVGFDHPWGTVTKTMNVCNAFCHQ